MHGISRKCLVLLQILFSELAISGARVDSETRIVSIPLVCIDNDINENVI